MVPWIGCRFNLESVRRVKNRFKQLRNDRGWTQADIAECLEISRQSVNAIETGKHTPSLPLAFRIADLFGCEIKEVFLWEK